MIASDVDAGEMLAKLAAPFPADAVEWRVQRAGKGARGVWAQLAPYLTPRAIMDRLDEVCGPGCWANRVEQLDGGAGYLSGIGILFDAEWVWRWDGAAATDVEPVKGGISSALKRAAVLWGVGRYLYRLDAAWADVADERREGFTFSRSKQKNGPDLEFWWRPPALPDWALPPPAARKEPTPTPDPERRPPVNGKPAAPGDWWHNRQAWGQPARSFGRSIDEWLRAGRDDPFGGERATWSEAAAILKRQGVTSVQAFAALRTTQALKATLDLLAAEASRKLGGEGVSIPWKEDV